MSAITITKFNNDRKHTVNWYMSNSSTSTVASSQKLRNATSRKSSSSARQKNHKLACWTSHTVRLPY